MADLNAHAGAKVDGLYNHRIGKLSLHGLHAGLFVFFVFIARKTNAVQHRHTGILEDRFHHILIHAHSAGQHIAAHYGCAQILQKSLQRAVLYIGAVYNGESHIQHGTGFVAKHTERILVQFHAALALYGDHLTALLEQRGLIGKVFDRAQSLTRVELVFPGDIHGNDLVFIAVHGIHGLQCRNHRNFVFHTVAAKKYTYSDFHNTLSHPLGCASLFIKNQ